MAVFKRARKETVLLWRYAGDVAAHWKGILGSAAVIATLWVAAHYGAALLALMLPHVPQEVSPWLTRNRLIVISSVLVLAVAQYRAWRKLRLAADEEAVDVGSGLSLEYERPSKVRGEDALEAGVRLKQSLTTEQELHVLCDAPIMHGNAWVGRTSSTEIRVIRQRHAVFNFRSPLEAGTLLEFRIYSSKSISLCKLQLTAKGKESSF